jgi:hypothetical protein
MIISKGLILLFHVASSLPRGGFTRCPEKLPCFTGPAAFDSVAFKIIGKQVSEDNTP